MSDLPDVGSAMAEIDEISIDDIPKEWRTCCEIWSRVMGYHRPTTSFNPGKLQEHKDRKLFIEPGREHTDTKQGAMS